MRYLTPIGIVLLLALALLLAHAVQAGDCSDAAFDEESCVPAELVAIDVPATKTLQAAFDAGDFGVPADSVGPDEMEDADHGDVSWLGGVATVEKAPQPPQCSTFYAPSDLVTTDDDVMIFHANAALTITEIWCITKGTGSPTVDLDIDNAGSRVNLDAWITCDSDGEAHTVFTGDDTVADNALVEWNINAVGGTTVEELMVCVEYTLD
jgi:hypothetical protein